MTWTYQVSLLCILQSFNDVKSLFVLVDDSCRKAFRSQDLVELEHIMFMWPSMDCQAPSSWKPNAPAFLESTSSQGALFIPSQLLATSSNARSY